MDYIWAPWRLEFILKGGEGGCFLCEEPKEDNDAENYILYRGKYNFIVLNAFPYNPGHLLVAPYRHTGKIEELNSDEYSEHFELMQLGVKLLTGMVKPDGFNVGMNLGRIAGAGVADHIHTHIVPRWQGDTNFMPVLGDTKVIPEALLKTYNRLKEGLDKLL
jgi:ATP adenylyltransferase